MFVSHVVATGQGIGPGAGVIHVVAADHRGDTAGGAAHALILIPILPSIGCHGGIIPAPPDDAGPILILVPGLQNVSLCLGPQSVTLGPGLLGIDLGLILHVGGLVPILAHPNGPRLPMIIIAGLVQNPNLLLHLLGDLGLHRILLGVPDRSLSPSPVPDLLLAVKSHVPVLP